MGKEIQNIWNPATGITDFELNEQGQKDISSSELIGIHAVWKDQREKLKGTKQLSEFTGRLSREWAIETGVLENLYEIERGVTLTLIERGFQSEFLLHGSTNKSRDYVIKLLTDHKDALDGVLDFVAQQRSLTTSYIKELHAALLRSQNTTDGINSQGAPVEIPLLKGTWKVQENYPEREGITYRYCPPAQVASEMDRLVEFHQSHIATGVPTDVKAAWLHHRFTQIHPFQDGNGRVARAIASLVFVKDGLFPLVVRRDDRTTYIEALEAADNGALEPLITLFGKLQRLQFLKAVAIADQVLSDDVDVQTMLNSLNNEAQKTADEKQENLKIVFTLSEILREHLNNRLESISIDVCNALKKIDVSAHVSVYSSTEETDHYYRGEIIENAREYLNYFADTLSHRSWVAMNMFWRRKAKLVFAIHGVGRPFSGSLICAPFLQFRDDDDTGEEASIKNTLMPVTDEGFVFFYNDDEEQLLKRFKPWVEGVIKVALKELGQNL